MIKDYYLITRSDVELFIACAILITAILLTLKLRKNGKTAK